MKRVIAIFLSVIMLMSLASCGESAGNGKIKFTENTPVEDVTKYLTLDALFEEGDVVSLQWYNSNNYSSEYTQSYEAFTRADGRLSSYSVFLNINTEEVMEVWNNYDGVSTYVLYNDVPFHTITAGLDEEMEIKNKFAFDYSQYDSRIESVKTDENGHYEIQIGAYTDGSLQCMGSYVIDPENGIMQKCTENYFFGAEEPYIVSACVVTIDPEKEIRFNPRAMFESPHDLTVNYNGTAYTALVDNDTDVEFIDSELNSDYAVYHFFKDAALTEAYSETDNGHIGKVNTVTEIWCTGED